MAVHNVRKTECEFEFQDFDSPDVFREVRETAADPSSTNFVVEFGHDGARIARNLELQHFEKLDAQRDDKYPIRWINIWDTSAKKDITAFVGKKYDFSQRMISLMQSATDHNLKVLAAKAAAKRKAEEAKNRAGRPSAHVIRQDIEKGRLSTSTRTPETIGAVSAAAGEEVALFMLLKDKVNYSSIDQTDNALCIGAHWLHERVNVQNVPKKSDSITVPSLMPPKHWLWLVLGSDDTVVSLHEDPILEDPSDDYRARCLERIRANTHNVLLQLSNGSSDLFLHKPLSQSSIRQALQDKQRRWDEHLESSPSPAPAPAPDHRKEGASNLFYYLFEDYAAAATFQAAEKTLNELTPIVLGSDTRKMKTETVEIIPKLHNLGKDLRELKHLFENYKAMIRKILDTTKPEKSQAFSRASLGHPDGETSSVVMAKSARERFERLGERLQWLMLNTIQGYQDETAALSDTYFNLMQQKDTAATARLNRSATFLAKLSVFFLPLSFVTSYYSIQIEEMYAGWHTSDFVSAMGITVGLSFFVLFFFNKVLFILIDSLEKMSDMIESGIRHAWQALVRWSVLCWVWLRMTMHSQPEESQVVKEDQAEASQMDERLSQKGVSEPRAQR